MAKNVDRITEAYNGAFGMPFAKINRDRIHWLCSEAKGEKILDVGCSQGIASIILAREGKKVTAIDICQESIDFALNSLDCEDVVTRENVSFVCTDFITHSENGETYDCVIMSEVLEHLADPERFIKRANEILTTDGVFVVTVPFGINDYHDHKRTYYITELHGQISKQFCISNTFFYDKPNGVNCIWMGLVGKKLLEPRESVKMCDKLFAKAERAFFLHEESLLRVRNELRSSVDVKSKVIEDLNKKQSECAKLEANYKELQNALTKSEDKVTELQNALTKSEDKVTELQNLSTKSESEYRKLKDEFADMQLRERQAYKRYDDLSKSKLGKIQVGIWRRRTNKKIKKNKKVLYRPTLTERVKEILRKIPFLVKVVRYIRGQKVTAQQKKEPVLKVVMQSAKQEFDLGYMNRIEPILQKVPTSTSGRYYVKSNKKIAIISDEFQYNTYKDVAEVVALHPDSWMEQISGSDMLFVIAGWKGIDEEWRGFAVSGTKKRCVILEIIDHGKANNIPTVFYSKEDPPHYEDFLEVAKKCDYIFTTAEEMVSNYKRDCGHENVSVLMFSFNPLYHNPVGSYSLEKSPEVIFSGSYMQKYTERSMDLCSIFDGVLASSHGLKIIDRNYYLNDSRYGFPEKYTSFISPQIGHDVLQKVHKLHDWSININSVKNSKTMYANRVCELQASGSLMLSNYSVGVNSYFPLVFMAHDSQEATYIVDTLTQTDIQRRKAAGIRHAMTGHTCYDRINEIYSYIGFTPIDQRRVLAVVVDEISEEAKKTFECQTYPFKEMITLSELADFYDKFDMVAFMSPKMDYDSFYLEDMVNAFKYTDSDYITKDSYFEGVNLIKGKSHDFVDALPSKFCTVFWASAFEAEYLLDMPVGLVLLPNGYSIDNLHFNARLPEVPMVSRRRNYLISVIVPVYNNGLHLYGKAFGSLQRSSIFENMEIILVDDGSTDSITGKYVRYIEKHYDNVKAYFYNDGGSGSASRPRNKGVELSSARHLTFLDPDNEAINDGYTRLYEIAVKEEFDLVVGDMVMFQEKRSLLNYYYYFKNVYGTDVVDGDKKDFLRKISFTPMSIQGMIIDRTLIEKSSIKQVEGAIGEDSLFSWQLIANANRIKAVNFPVHIYYAQVAGSTVNSINKRFFERSFLIEPARFTWLNDEGLLYDYMQLRFNNYFREWTMKKLSLVNDDFMEDCVSIVGDIFEVYRDYYDGKDSVINTFIKDTLKKNNPNLHLPYDIGYIERISSRTNNIPTSNKGRYYGKSNLRVAIISDSSIFNSFINVTELILLSPSQWRMQIEGCDLLFVSTSPTSINAEWPRLLIKNSEHQSIANSIFEYCKRNNIPTASYANMDPKHSNGFMNIVQNSDHVFVSDENLIERYRHELRHDRVYSLMFGFDPLCYNPVGSLSYRKCPEVIFSGTWIEGSPERNEDLKMMLDGVLQNGRGLKIIDCNYRKGNGERSMFPSQYNPYISPDVDLATLQKIHKLHNWAILAESEVESAIMVSERILELQALGNLIISNDSFKVQNHVPNIFTAKSIDDVGEILHSLTPHEMEERRSIGIRQAMTGHTCYDWFHRICTVVGLPSTLQNRSLAVVVKNKTQKIVDLFNKQTYPDKKLVLDSELEASYTDYDMVTFFCESMFYNSFYLEDMINGFKYTHSDYITKDSYFVGDKQVIGRQHDFVQKLHNKYCAVFWRESFGYNTLLEIPDDGMRLENGYSIDCLNFKLSESDNIVLCDYNKRLIK